MVPLSFSFSLHRDNHFRLKALAYAMANPHMTSGVDFGESKDLSIAVAYYTDGTKEKYKYVGGSGVDSSDGSLAHYELEAKGTWGSTFADTYQLTTFDKLVGWSRWLLLNEAAPPAWSPSSFYFKLPLDDMSDIPTI